ncbi:MAG: hypothetical protein K0R54_4418 [Clostridiaceae bacterium]|jgi:predicted transcriptional regulator with HTH domain|nr:hypothetical protein [Clostridiaceae bacterium]
MPEKTPEIMEYMKSDISNMKTNISNMNVRFDDLESVCSKD